MKVGSIVTPKTPAGLWLADAPITGEYKQQRNNVCVFSGSGIIVAVSECIIDYDEWDRSNGTFVEELAAGKVKYRNCLVRCEAGTGWAGEGALIELEAK